MSAFAALVLSAVAAACVIAPRRPFVGLLAYLWLDFMRPHEMDAQVHALRPMLVVAVVTLAAVLWQWRRGASRRLASIPLPLLALTAAVGLSGNWSADPSAAVAGVIEIGKMLLLVWLIGTLVTTKDRLHAVLGVIALSLAVHAAMAVQQGIERGLMHEFHIELVVQGPGAGLGGGWVDNNNLARVLAMGLPLWWALAAWPQRRWTRIPCVAGVLLIVLGIEFTFSRGGFLAMSVAIAGVAIGRWPVWRGALIAALVVSGLLALSPQAYRNRVATIGDAATDRSVQGRFEVWRKAAKMILERPLRGHGVGSLRVEVGEGPTARRLVSHNVFVELVAETGIVGLAAYGWMLLATLAALQHARRRDDAGSWLGVSADGVLAALLAYLTASLALSGPFYSPLFVLVGLSGALGSMAYRTGCPPSAGLRSVPVAEKFWPLRQGRG